VETEDVVTAPLVSYLGAVVALTEVMAHHREVLVEVESTEAVAETSCREEEVHLQLPAALSLANSLPEAARALSPEVVVDLRDVPRGKLLVAGQIMFQGEEDPAQCRLLLAMPNVAVQWWLSVKLTALLYPSPQITGEDTGHLPLRALRGHQWEPNLEHPFPNVAVMKTNLWLILTNPGKKFHQFYVNC
jgi:hypothetical protein